MTDEEVNKIVTKAKVKNGFIHLIIIIFIFFLLNFCVYIVAINNPNIDTFTALTTTAILTALIGFLIIKKK